MRLSLLRMARFRPRLLTSTGAAIMLFCLSPGDLPLSTRLLVAWDAGSLLYLVLAFVMMLRASPGVMRDRAKDEDAGAVAVLVISLLTAMAGLFAIAAELHGIHEAPARAQGVRVGIAAATILCSWFFVHLVFAIHYAHDYYGRGGTRGGLVFPGDAEIAKEPDYLDFLYFSFTIGAAAQTSDVAVVSRRMRRLVLAHTVVAFLFNTTILALAVNVGAGIL